MAALGCPTCSHLEGVRAPLPCFLRLQSIHPQQSGAVPFPAQFAARSETVSESPDKHVPPAARRTARSAAAVLQCSATRYVGGGTLAVLCGGRMLPTVPAVHLPLDNACVRHGCPPIWAGSPKTYPPPSRAARTSATQCSTDAVAFKETWFSRSPRDCSWLTRPLLPPPPSINKALCARAHAQGYLTYAPAQL